MISGTGDAVPEYLRTIFGYRYGYMEISDLFGKKLTGRIIIRIIEDRRIWRQCDNRARRFHMGSLMTGVTRLCPRFSAGSNAAVFDLFVERFYGRRQRRILMIAVHLSFEFSNNILCFLKLIRKQFISVFKSTDLFFKVIDFNEILNLMIRSC